MTARLEWVVLHDEGCRVVETLVEPNAHIPLTEATANQTVELWRVLGRQNPRKTLREAA